MEFVLLKKPLESELRDRDQIKPIRYFLLSLGLFVPMSIFLFADRAPYILMIFGGVWTLFFLIHKFTHRKPELQFISDHTLDKLLITEHPFAVHTASGKYIIYERFTGTVTAKYNGYYKMVRELYYGKYATVHYGTGNVLVIDYGDSRQHYFLFLKGKAGKQKFFQLMELLAKNRIVVQEYTWEHRTYLGNKLSYREIQEFKARYYSD